MDNYQNENYKNDNSFSVIMDDYDKIKYYILSKLVRRRIWHHKHTSIHNLPKGIPNQLRNNKLTKKVISNLLRDKWLLSKPTHYGLELSLNINKKKEIEDYIEKNM
jgi:hypothetical protein